MSDLKLSFIRQCLVEYNEKTIAAMRVAAQRMGLNPSGPGLQSLAYKALQEGGGAYSTLSFHEYLRMVDMGVGRGHPLGSLTRMTQTLHSSNYVGTVQVKDKTYKPKKFYSRVAYGNLTWLENKLLHGYTEEAIEQLRQNLLANGS